MKGYQTILSLVGMLVISGSVAYSQAPTGLASDTPAPAAPQTAQPSSEPSQPAPVAKVQSSGAQLIISAPVATPSSMPAAAIPPTGVTRTADPVAPAPESTVAPSSVPAMIPPTGVTVMQAQPAAEQPQVLPTLPAVSSQQTEEPRQE